MLGFQTDIVQPVLRKDAIARNCALAADEIALSVKNFVKIAISSNGAIATGKTLKSVKAEKLLDSASRGLFQRAVTANKSWNFIQTGRKAGGKLPVVRVAGVGKRGGSLFLPVPELMEWFEALNIPRSRWFPIIRAIAKRGIKPRNIRDQALKEATPRINQITERLKQNIIAQLFGNNP